jgi:hypothetical protein
MSVRLRRLVPFLVLFILSTTSCPILAQTVYSASGLANVNAIATSFRTALGTLNPNVAGSFGSGRREINWDGVPDALATPNNLPANFFNVNSPRGVVFATPGTAFQVSANSSAGPVEFGNINATYPMHFATFSAQRLFTAVGSNVLDVTFYISGSATPAKVTGFGAVFTDVDNASTTSIQYFDGAGLSLGTYFVPAAANDLSFLGVVFATATVGRVRISSGNAALGPNNNPPATDVVVMDDFIYGEPILATSPVLVGVVSRKVHGAAGTFNLPLGNVASNPTTEPRVGPTQTIVFTFDSVVTAGTASLSEGAATVGTPTFGGNEMVVPLSAVNNAQYVTVSVGNVSTAGGGTGGAGSARIGFLAGDVNQSRAVTVADLGLINAQLAQPVTAANYLKDVNASGTLTIADKGIANGKLTTSLPLP